MLQLSEQRIIELRQKTKAKTLTPWADIIAFAHAILAEANLQLELVGEARTIHAGDGKSGAFTAEMYAKPENYWSSPVQQQDKLYKIKV